MSNVLAPKLPDNTDLWTPEDRERPSCSALPDSIVAELNAHYDAIDALRAATEDPAGDDARCEAAAVVVRQVQQVATLPKAAFVVKPASVKVFELHAGTTSQHGIYIESSRTGKTIIVTRAHIEAIDRRLFGRVVKARAEGKRQVPFTRDELCQLVNVAS